MNDVTNSRSYVTIQGSRGNTFESVFITYNIIFKTIINDNESKVNIFIQNCRLIKIQVNGKSLEGPDKIAPNFLFDEKYDRY